MNAPCSSIFLVDDVILSTRWLKSFFSSFTKCRIADHYRMLYKVIAYRIVWLYLIITRADQILPYFAQRGSVPCIGYMCSIAIQGTALDYTRTIRAHCLARAYCTWLRRGQWRYLGKCKYTQFIFVFVYSKPILWPVVLNTTRERTYESNAARDCKGPP